MSLRLFAADNPLRSVHSATRKGVYAPHSSKDSEGGAESHSSDLGHDAILALSTSNDPGQFHTPISNSGGAGGGVDQSPGGSGGRGGVSPAPVSLKLFATDNPLKSSGRKSFTSPGSAGGGGSSGGSAPKRPPPRPKAVAFSTDSRDIPASSSDSEVIVSLPKRAPPRPGTSSDAGEGEGEGGGDRDGSGNGKSPTQGPSSDNASGEADSEAMPVPPPLFEMKTPKRAPPRRQTGYAASSPELEVDVEEAGEGGTGDSSVARLADPISHDEMMEFIPHSLLLPLPPHPEHSSDESLPPPF